MQIFGDIEKPHLLNYQWRYGTLCATFILKSDIVPFLKWCFTSDSYSGAWKSRVIVVISGFISSVFRNYFNCC